MVLKEKESKAEQENGHKGRFFYSMDSIAGTQFNITVSTTTTENSLKI